jgi:hypothetical protein
LFIVKLTNYSKENQKFLRRTCNVDPAPDDDYVKFYGHTKPDGVTQYGKIFRLTPRREKQRDEVMFVVNLDPLGAARCDYCQTMDWIKHHPHCPIETPVASPERSLNQLGEKHGRQGAAPVEPNNPSYMLGYDWGLEVARYPRLQRITIETV